VADIYELAHLFRLGILRRERKTAALLADDYRTAARAMRAALDSLLVKIAEAREAGEIVSESWLLRQRRFEALLIQVDEEISKFSSIAEGRIIEAQGQAIEASLAQSYELMGAAVGNVPGINISFHRLPKLAVENLAGFLADGSPLSSILSSLSADAVAVVRASLINGVVSGHGVRKIAGGMREALGGNLRRAQLIARTEVLRAYRETSRQTYSANRDVLNGWRWHSALDSRTCAICYAMHGTLHGFNETLNDHPQGRCFPSGVRASGPAPVSASSRYYSGELVSIRTTSGTDLSFTPNHPILTLRGWVAGGLLKEGDYVIRSPLSEDRAATINENNYQVPAGIEKIFESLGVVLGEMPSAAEDFHGDGGGSDVYVVRSNGLLGNGVYPPIREPFAQNVFSRGDVRRSDLSGLGDLALMLERQLLSPTGILGNSDAAVMLRHRGSISKEPVRRDLVSQFYPGAFQSQLNNVALCAECAGKSIDALPGQIAVGDFINREPIIPAGGFPNLLGDEFVSSGAVAQESFGLEYIRESLRASVESSGDILRTLASNVATDRIVDISVRAFTGHVYNLQSSAKWYIVNGIIAHNCVMLPETKSYRELGLDIPDDRRPVESGESRFAKLTAEQQQAVLGRGAYERYRAGKLKLPDLVGERVDPKWGLVRYRKPLSEVAQ
jgi:SPP1 gp7 family putative phage head morphogenesis protein